MYKKIIFHNAFPKGKHILPGGQRKPVGKKRVAQLSKKRQRLLLFYQNARLHEKSVIARSQINAAKYGTRRIRNGIRRIRSGIRR